MWIGDLTSSEGWTVRGEINDGEINDGETVGLAFGYCETEQGKVYFGEVENNQKHGFGIMISPDETGNIGGVTGGDTAKSAKIGAFSGISSNNK